MFFIRWTGYGISAPVIIIVGIFGVTSMTRAAYGSSYMAAHPSAFWLGLALGGFLCWWMGLSLKNDEPKTVQDQQTGQEVVLQKSHTLYGVPMHWWGVAAMVAGLFLAVKGSPSPIHYSRPVTAQINPETEPSAGQSYDPGAKPSQGAAAEPQPPAPDSRTAQSDPGVASASPAKSSAAEPEAKPEQNAAPGSQQVPPGAGSHSEQEAIRLYPALGVMGSPFNSKFLALHEKYMSEHPDYFSDPDWPVKLAREVGKSAH
jgi:hypothetical protein